MISVKIIVLLISIIILLGLNSFGVLGLPVCECESEWDCPSAYFCDDGWAYHGGCAGGDEPPYYMGLCIPSTEGRPCGRDESCQGGLWCDSWMCCPLGCEWEGGSCYCPDPCYDTECSYRPPNDPNGGQSGWWSSSSCISASQACCYAGTYGQLPWYDKVTYSIEVY